MKEVKGKPWENYSEASWESRKAGHQAVGISRTEPPDGWLENVAAPSVFFLVISLGLSEYLLCNFSLIVFSGTLFLCDSVGYMYTDDPHFHGFLSSTVWN